MQGPNRCRLQNNLYFGTGQEQEQLNIRSGVRVRMESETKISCQDFGPCKTDFEKKKRLLHHNYVQNVKQNDEQEQFATFEQGLESKL